MILVKKMNQLKTMNANFLIKLINLFYKKIIKLILLHILSDT